MKKDVPIVLFVYNRPEHTKKTLDYLNHNRGIDNTVLYIFSDGAKKGEEQKIENVRRILREFLNKSHFKNLYIEESTTNKGLANSVISGVTNIFNQYDKVIVLEDDLLTATDFYQYMRDALAYYQEDNRVWSITGYSPRMKRLEKTSHKVYTSPRAGSWGWGTWKDRWETIDWDVSDYDSFKNDEVQRRLFDKRSPGMAHMLDLQMEGKIDSWAIRWCYQQHKNGMYTINPVKSKIMNIGNDGTGTHNETDNKWNISFDNTNEKTVFEPVKIDKRVFKEYNKYFTNPLWRRIYKRIKRMINSLGIASRCVN